MTPIPSHLRLVTLDEYRARQTTLATAPSAPAFQAPATKRAFSFGDRVSSHRAAYEFYPTPQEATRALLSVESFDGDIWEPACGKGHISRILEDHKYRVVSTDLATCWGYGDTGRDFLAEKTPLAKHIITNPPYGKGLADAFVRHALNLTRKTFGKVAMLVAIQSLAHPLRHELWTSNPPSTVHILDECVCWPYGDPSKATTAIGKQRYAWVVWDAHYKGPTVLRWVSTKPFKGAPTFCVVKASSDSC